MTYSTEEWVKEERRVAIQNKKVEEVIDRIKELSKDLEGAKMSFGYAGGYYRRSSSIFVSGWRKKTTDELAADKKAAEEAAARKAKQKAEAAARRKRQAALARKRRKAEQSRIEAAQIKAATTELLSAQREADALVKALRSAGYDISRKKP